MQTHHSITTAYKLVPGNNYHYLELCVIIHAWLLLVEVFFRGVHLECEKNPIHIIHFISALGLEFSGSNDIVLILPLY
jgi:hypothetical protein